MFVNVIYIFTAIRWCTLYELLLGCNPSWEACNAYKYMICYAIVAILVDHNLQKWINILKKYCGIITHTWERYRTKFPG